MVMPSRWKFKKLRPTQKRAVYIAQKCIVVMSENVVDASKKS